MLAVHIITAHIPTHKLHITPKYFYLCSLLIFSNKENCAISVDLMSEKTMTN